MVKRYSPEAYEHEMGPADARMVADAGGIYVALADYEALQRALNAAELELVRLYALEQAVRDAMSGAIKINA